jgi:hypothetical protein
MLAVKTDAYVHRYNWRSPEPHHCSLNYIYKKKAFHTDNSSTKKDYGDRILQKALAIFEADT